MTTEPEAGEPPDDGGGKDGRKEAIFAMSPLGGLTGEGRRELLVPARVERLPRRFALTRQGEALRALALIGAGRVRLARQHDGLMIPLGHRGPGESVGETALAAGPAAGETAVVLDEAEALLIPLPAFRRTMARDAAVRRAAIDLLVGRRLETETRLASLLLHGIELRLVAFLLGALARWGRPHPAGGETLAAPFTHADLADLVGSTRETVTLLLGKLRRAGLIDLDRRQIVVRNRAELEARLGALR